MLPCTARVPLAQYKDANFQNLLIVMNVVSYIYNMHNSTSNEKILHIVSRSRDEEKVKKQDGMSMIIVNYSDKIIRK